jgi:hypothetical protein
LILAAIRVTSSCSCSANSLLPFIISTCVVGSSSQ